jgi:hypothetical protein
VGIFSTEGNTSGLLYATPLLGGDVGTEQTISLLRSLVDDAWKDSFVNRTAIEIVRNAGVQPYDSWGQIRAIYNWVKGNFYFVNDPVTKEALRPTRELLQLMAGDCDDINANVIPALLGTIGYETRLVTIAADPNAPDSFSHVYAEVFQDGNWYPLDAARPGAVFGVAPPNFFRRAWWSLSDGSHGDYAADGTMSGYSPIGIRGLGSIVSDVESILQGASSGLRAVNGQMVQSPIGPAIGPGGAMSLSPSAPAGFSLSSGTGELFLLAAIGFGLWMVMKD